MRRAIYTISFLGMLIIMNLGCATIIVRTQTGPYPPPTHYPAVKYNVEEGFQPIFEPTVKDPSGLPDYSKLTALAMLPLTVIDICISSITDTVCLPFDIYAVSRYDKD